MRVETDVADEPLSGNLHPDGDRCIFTVNADTGAGGQEARPERIVLVENFVEEMKRPPGK